MSSFSVTLRYHLSSHSQGIFPIISLFARLAVAFSDCLICPKTKSLFLSCGASFALLFILFLEDFVVKSYKENTPQILKGYHTPHVTNNDPSVRECSCSLTSLTSFFFVLLILPLFDFLSLSVSQKFTISIKVLGIHHPCFQRQGKADKFWKKSVFVLK